MHNKQSVRILYYNALFLCTPDGIHIIHDSFTQAPAAMLSLQWEGGEDYLGFPPEQIFKPAVYSTLKT